MKPFISPINTDLDFDEFYKLIKICETLGTPYSIERLLDGYKLNLYDLNANLINDAIIHAHSYGHDIGLLECWKPNLNDVIGSLTAREVYEIFEESLQIAY